MKYPPRSLFGFRVKHRRQGHEAGRNSRLEETENEALNIDALPARTSGAENKDNTPDYRIGGARSAWPNSLGDKSEL